MIEKFLAFEKTATFKLITLLVVGLVGWYLVTSLVAKHDQATADRFTQLLTQEKATTATAQAQIAQQAQVFATAQAQYNTDRAALLAQVQTLQVAISSRDAAVKTKDAAVISLPQDTVATQIVTDLGLVATDITAQSNGSYLFDRPAANAVLISENNAQTAQADLKDTQSELVEETKRADEADATLDKADALISQGKDLLASKDKIIELEEKNTEAQVEAQKSKDRKHETKVVAIFSTIAAIAARILIK